jgi:hypothetical protein
MKNLIIIFATFLTSSLFANSNTNTNPPDSTIVQVNNAQANITSAGESLMRVSTFQVLAIAVTPLYFVTPVIAGMVQVVCLIETLSHTHKAGKQLSETKLN